MKKISVLAAIIFLFTIGPAWAQEVNPDIPEWVVEEGPVDPTIPGEVPAVQAGAEAGAAQGDGEQTTPEPSQTTQQQQ